MTKKQNEINTRLAETIEDFCKKWTLQSEMRIYFNNKAWCYDSDGKKTVKENIKGSEYFTYANDKTVSVSTEGNLYDVINGSYGWSLKEELDDLLKEQGYYYELGEPWNFSLCEV